MNKRVENKRGSQRKMNGGETCSIPSVPLRHQRTGHRVKGTSLTSWDRVQYVPQVTAEPSFQPTVLLLALILWKLFLKLYSCVLKNNIFPFSSLVFFFFFFFAFLFLLLWQHRGRGIVVANKANVCFCQRSVIECICCNGGR